MRVGWCLAACLGAAQATSLGSTHHTRSTEAKDKSEAERSVKLANSKLSVPENAVAVVKNTYSSNGDVIKIYEVAASWDAVPNAKQYRFCYDSLDLWRRTKCVITTDTTYNNGDTLYLVNEIEGRFANARVRAENKGSVSEYTTVSAATANTNNSAQFEPFCSNKREPEYNTKFITSVTLDSGKLVTTQSDVEVPVKVAWKPSKSVNNITSSGYEVCVSKHSQHWAGPPILTVGDYTCVLTPASARSATVPVTITPETEYLVATVRPLDTCQDMGVSKDSEWVYPRQLYTALEYAELYAKCVGVNETVINGTTTAVLGGTVGCNTSKAARFFYTNNMEWKDKPFALELPGGTTSDSSCVTDDKESGRAQIVECSEKDKNQKWTWVYEQRAKKWVKNLGTGRCMAKDGNDVVMTSCKDQARNQWFTFTLVPLE